MFRKLWFWIAMAIVFVLCYSAFLAPLLPLFLNFPVSLVVGYVLGSVAMKLWKRYSDPVKVGDRIELTATNLLGEQGSIAKKFPYGYEVHLDTMPNVDLFYRKDQLKLVGKES